MNDEARAELRELQARAYGRDGDIHDDPGALQRLHELQARAALADAAVAAPTFFAEADELDVAAESTAEARGGIEAGVADRGEPGGEVPDPAESVAAEADSAEDDEAPPRSRWRTWTPWLWIGSVLVAAGLATTWNLASAAFTLIAGDSGVRQVEVIGIDSSFDGWQALGPVEDQIGFHDFYGVTPIAADGAWWGGDSDADCLIIGRTTEVDSGSENINGPLFTGCSAGPFPATVQFVVTLDFPAEFQDRFPPGEAVQFVLGGDRVSVFTGTD